MLPSHLAASAAASVLLLVTGTQTLTPLAQPSSQEVAVVNPVYPSDPGNGNLISWMKLLNRDLELYELSSTCEDPGLDPLETNYNDAKITGYPSYGILQFQPGTFLAGVKLYNAYPGASDKKTVPVMPDKALGYNYLQRYADKYKLSVADRNILAAIYDPYLQIYVGRHMINDHQGPQWTCYGMLHLADKYPVWTTKSSAVSKKLD